MTRTLQSVIEKLNGFWHTQGCAVLPPCSFEVPLGLLHPEAFFRLLDPEPWRASFVQPISRPADARGGQHPYRVARHLQLQVVWKDIDPRAPRDLMLRSLEEVGFDLSEHDIRFIDQDLRIEAAEIRGRGWRVVLDGLRLGRISFLDHLAGESLVRPSVELSYGVELVAMALNEAEDIFAVPWRSALGEEERAQHVEAAAAGRAKRREGEEELHTYALDIANVAYLRQAIDGLDQEALRCIEAGLPRIAYEQAMRMLPLLDLLETRGDLSLRERNHWLAEIRSRVVEAGREYKRSIAGKAPLIEDPAPRVPQAQGDLAGDGEMTDGERAGAVDPEVPGKGGESAEGETPEPEPTPRAKRRRKRRPPKKDATAKSPEGKGA